MMAQAGFRVISLDWNRLGLTARLECRTVIRHLVSTDEELNDCLPVVRDERNYEGDEAIIPELVAVLGELGSTDVTWLDFLTLETGSFPSLPQVVPDWSRIVLAGYSEGANQVAYNLRQFDVFGAIMVSGGGDRGTILETRNLADWTTPALPTPLPPLADWMTPLPESRRRVAMYALQERRPALLNVGWTRSGVPRSTADADPGPPYYTSFDGANRLVHDCVDCSESEAHASTKDDPALKPAWMYLACRAGRVDAF
jgi:hypothetical protein